MLLLLLRSVVETGEQEVTLAVLPFFHIYAMTTIMIMGLRLGMKIITLPKFDPELYIKALINYKPTLLTWCRPWSASSPRSRPSSPSIWLQSSM